MTVILVNGKFEIDPDDPNDDYDSKPDPIYDVPRDNPKLSAKYYLAFTTHAFQEQMRIIRKLKEQCKQQSGIEAFFMRADLNALERFTQNAHYGFELGNLQTRRWQDAYYTTKKQLDNRTIQVLFLWNVITRRFIPIQIPFDFAKDDEADKTDKTDEVESY